MKQYKQFQSGSNKTLCKNSDANLGRVNSRTHQQPNTLFDEQSGTMVDPMGPATELPFSLFHAMKLKEHEAFSKAVLQKKHQQTQVKNSDEGMDHLLVLASSAVREAESEENLDGVHVDSISNTDKHCSVKERQYLPLDTYVRSETVESTHEVKRPRLSQIRHLARNKHMLMEQNRFEDCPSKLYGIPVRLSKLKRMARSTSMAMASTNGCGQLHQGRTTCLRQIKRQARLNVNALLS